MELPEMPERLQLILQHLDIKKKQLTWKLHDSTHTISLTLVWKSANSNSPSKGIETSVARLQSKQMHITSVNNRSIASDSITGMSSGKILDMPKKDDVKVDVKKKKSPCRLRRDRKRLSDFRNRMKQKHQDKDTPVATVDSPSSKPDPNEIEPVVEEVQYVITTDLTNEDPIHSDASDQVTETLRQNTRILEQYQNCRKALKALDVLSSDLQTSNSVFQEEYDHVRESLDSLMADAFGVLSEKKFDEINERFSNQYTELEDARSRFRQARHDVRYDMCLELPKLLFG